MCCNFISASVALYKPSTSRQIPITESSVNTPLSISTTKMEGLLETQITHLSQIVQVLNTMNGKIDPESILSAISKQSQPDSKSPSTSRSPSAPDRSPSGTGINLSRKPIQA